MKTIIDNTTKLSKYIYDDNIEVVMYDYYIRVKDSPEQSYLTDVNATNSTIVYDVSTGIDWAKDKFRVENGQWIVSNGLESLTLEEAKIVLMDQLKRLRKTLSATVNECVLVNDPIPVELTGLMANTRDMYEFGKWEIESLTEATYKNYILQGPMVNALINGYQQFL